MSKDIYQSARPVGPALRGFDIPSSLFDADLPNVTTQVFVGVGGDLVVQWVGGARSTFRNVAQGTLFNIRADMICSGTTASGLVGLY